MLLGEKITLNVAFHWPNVVSFNWTKYNMLYSTMLLYSYYFLCSMYCAHYANIYVLGILTYYIFPHLQYTEVSISKNHQPIFNMFFFTHYLIWLTNDETFAEFIYFYLCCILLCKAYCILLHILFLKYTGKNGNLNVVTSKIASFIQVRYIL